VWVAFRVYPQLSCHTQMAKFSQGSATVDNPTHASGSARSLAASTSTLSPPRRPPAREGWRRGARVGREGRSVGARGAPWVWRCEGRAEGRATRGGAGGATAEVTKELMGHQGRRRLLFFKFRFVRKAKKAMFVIVLILKAESCGTHRANTALLLRGDAFVIGFMCLLINSLTSGKTAHPSCNVHMRAQGTGTTRPTAPGRGREPLRP